MEIRLTPRELLTTTRTVRKRLDFARSVERDIVEDCLAVAFQAPNGSNQQLWDWVLVDDAERRAEMAAIYRAGLDAHLALPHRVAYAVQAPMNRLEPRHSLRFLCASIFDQASPAHGLASCCAHWRMGKTTLHLHREAEMAELSGIPLRLSTATT